MYFNFFVQILYFGYTTRYFSTLITNTFQIIYIYIYINYVMYLFSLLIFMLFKKNIILKNNTILLVSKE